MSSLSRHLAILSGFLLCAWAVCAWWFGYVTQLQYESPDSFFMFGSQFLQQWAARPGDLTLYATRFLRQFSHYTWLGTLVAATAATALGLVAHLVARRLRPEPSVLHTVLPAVALLVLHARGGDLAVGALLCYALFLGYLTLGSGPAGRAYTVAATVILYVIGGAFAWPFALWILAYESRGRQGRDNLGFRAAYLALTLCLPWVAYRWLYGISLSVALRHPIYPAGSALELCLGLYLVLLPLALARRWPWALQSRLGPGRALAATLSATAVAAAVLLGLSHDAGSAEVARYHRLYRARQWDSLLEMARSDPSPSGMSQFFTNFALAQKGQLLEQMFTYPQQYGTGGLVLSFSTSDEHLSRAMYASDLFFEMGHTNAAFRLAYNQRNLGRSYANLRRMAECNIANGSYEIAAKYLHMLEKTLYHREYARHYLRLLADPTTADTCLAAVRRLRPSLELDLGLGAYAALVSLLETQPGNRLAADYLVAWCLLDKDALPTLIASWPRLGQAGYRTVPVHCQEALLLWGQLAGGDGADLPGIDPPVRERFARFGQQLRGFADRASAATGLEESFGGTYMYYYAAVEPTGPRTRPVTWVRLGNEYRIRGRADEALICYRQAVATPPRYGAAHLYLADALTAAGRTAEAASHYRQVLQRDPATGQMRVRLDQAWNLGSH